MAFHTSSTKRPRSPSPQLPLHLFTSLPSSSHLAPSTTSNDPATRINLPLHLVHGLQAHEATLLPCHEFQELVEELEDLPAESLHSSGADEVESRRGKRMVKWAGSNAAGKEGGVGEVWTDRYDLLHLLPTLPSTYPSHPTISAITQGDPDLERGFDFLPSEHEELFFFTPQERVELERKKKRRKVEEGREERVRMLEERERAEQAEQNEADKTCLQPSAEQLALMQQLHRTLQTSPNPSLLELRILANHGSDPRFRFLLCKGQGQGEEKNGGKLSEVWERIRRGEDPLGREKEIEKEAAMGGGGLGGLVAYGSSDEEEDEAGGAEGEEEVEVAGKEKGNEGDVQDDAVGAAAGTAEDIGDEKQVAKPSPVEATRRSASVPGATGEPGTELDEAQRRKQLEKQERAKEWARKRKEKREAEESAEQ